MGQIAYRNVKNLCEREVSELYQAVGWTAYTKDIPKLMKAIENSLRVITVWDDEMLVGLVRVVGDGYSILYIQDLLVKAEYRRRGIGTTLIQQILQEFSHVRQKVLLTDNQPETRSFYEHLGFAACERGDLVAFAKFD